MYRYRLSDAAEIDSADRSLCELAVELASIILGIGKPIVRFIAACDDGFIKMKLPINAYSPSNGKEFFVRSGLTPGELVTAAIHETRHVWQWRNRAWASRPMAVVERDAELFSHEVWGNHARNGDHAALTRTLGLIHIEWVKAAVSARRVDLSSAWTKPGRNNFGPRRIEFTS